MKKQIFSIFINLGGVVILSYFKLRGEGGWEGWENFHFFPITSSYNQHSLKKRKLGYQGI